MSMEAIVAELNRRLMIATVVRLPNGLGEHKRPVAQMRCVDGFSVSVQAHRGAYCIPRGNVGPWSSFELGFPSAPMPELAEYCQDGDPATATETVWGYVPAERVASVIIAHGGLAEGWKP